MKIMKVVAVLGLLGFGTSAYAWDCSVWTSNVPGMECYKPPVTPGPTATSDSNAVAQSASAANATASQSQGQVQGQHQTATGGNATAANEGNSQYVNANSYSPRQAPSVAEGSIIISGCAVSGNAGGSNTHGSAFLGIGFTTPECYAFILAQAYQAVGEKQTACQILNTTNAAQRAIKRGITLPTCQPVPEKVVVVEKQVTGTYTHEQVDEIVRKAVQK